MPQNRSRCLERRGEMHPDTRGRLHHAASDTKSLHRKRAGTENAAGNAWEPLDVGTTCTPASVGAGPATRLSVAVTGRAASPGEDGARGKGQSHGLSCHRRRRSQRVADQEVRIRSVFSHLRNEENGGGVLQEGRRLERETATGAWGGQERPTGGSPPCPWYRSFVPEWTLSLPPQPWALKAQDPPPPPGAELPTRPGNTERPHGTLGTPHSTQIFDQTLQMKGFWRGNKSG